LSARKLRPVAVVCRTDRRSAQAIRQLREAGYDQLLLVPGGMEAWNRGGLPVER
jgi:rhodanese-related sulfurtransferase